MDKVYELARRIQIEAERVKRDYKNSSISSEFKDGVLSNMIVVFEDLEELFKVDLSDYDFDYYGLKEDK